MKHTPMHDSYNPDLLNFLHKNHARVVEVGSSSGALAKAYREINQHCHYIGIEIDPEYADASRRNCTEVIQGNIELFDDEIFSRLFPVDCWIFGDVLEHLYDPWKLLARIREKSGSQTEIVACIPNMQHWSIQANLSCGLFRYQNQGLMDKTHIRWFTRQTIIDMFETCGYRIVEGFPRVFDEPQREVFLPIIGEMAKAAGANPEQAMDDARPIQWVIRAIPA